MLFITDLTLFTRIEEHACLLSYIVVNLKIIQIIVGSFVFKLNFLFLKKSLILRSQNSLLTVIWIISAYILLLMGRTLYNWSE